jgi:hypothetical protein
MLVSTWAIGEVEVAGGKAVRREERQLMVPEASASVMQSGDGRALERGEGPVVVCKKKELGRWCWCA